ncbi:hypothetical protein NEUTE2DRAFT_153153 [Neurospora tetrasperma FGSC 2509]|nr:hypothetical protein NEUTE2DRAFT_153153 [Neurospora tetrasperma FGSC 2509]
MSLTARGVDLPIIDRTFLPSRFFSVKRMAFSNLTPSGRSRKEVAMGVCCLDNPRQHDRDNMETINRRVPIADGSRVSGAISCEIE